MIERNDFSLSALAVVIPGLLLMTAYPLAAFNSARFFTRTLFDRNIAAIITIMLIAYLVTMYDFDKAMLSTTDYSIFEMLRQPRTGKVVPDEEAELGYSLSFNKSDPGTLIYGPYRYMLPGEYGVRFRLRAKQAEFTDGVCVIGIIDVASNKGHRLIAHQPVKITPESVGRYHEFVLPFKLNRLEEVEFRLAGNQTADIQVDSIHLFRR